MSADETAERRRLLIRLWRLLRLLQVQGMPHHAALLLDYAERAPGRLPAWRMPPRDADAAYLPLLALME